MGIKGLTGFVAQRQAVVGKAIVFEAITSDSIQDHDDDNQPEEINLRDEEIEREQLIVDGSAFCYRISRLHLDWTKGGESATLRQVLSSYIQGFRNAHLNPIFVWDGVFDTCKLETVKSRIQSSIRSSITYFRSSPSLRTNRGFRNDSHLLPQLSIKACISHLRSIGEELDFEIEQHFPAGEADFYIANLAIQRNAFILSLDSDFFITSHGGKGYIPLDSLQFVKKERRKIQVDTIKNDEDGEWGEVKTSKRRHRTAVGSGSAAIDSADYKAISEANQIQCKVYTATALANSLSLPSVSYLPLCAILAGNDYYSPPIWKSSNSLSGSAHNGSTNGRAMSQRFEIVSAAILKQLRKSRKPLEKEGLHEFIRRVLDDIRDFAISEGHISDIAKLALNTLPEYCVSSFNTAPWLRSVTASRNGTETPISISSFGLETESSHTINPLHALLMPSMSSTSLNLPEQSDNIQIKLRIYNAFENGHFRNSLLQIIVFGTFTPSAILEDPDKTSNLVSLGRTLRLWIYAIFNGSIGIGRLGASSERQEDDSEQENQVIDGESEVADEGVISEEAEDSEEINTNTTITEYIRRNTSLAAEEIIVPNWSSLDPAQPLNNTSPLARSTLERFYILLHATSSYTDRLRDTSASHFSVLSVIIALRHICFTLDGTAQAWNTAERKAALLMALIVLQAYTGHAGALELLDKHRDPNMPISNEHMQRAAQLTTTLLSVSQLIEALLLTPLLSISPETMYQGSLFFEMLDMTCNDEHVDEGLLLQVGLEADQLTNLIDILEEGLPQAVSPAARLRSKKDKKKVKSDKKKAVAPDASQPGNTENNIASKRKSYTLGNKFAMLGMTN